MTAYLRLLREHPDYARLWLAQVISLTGDWFNTIVLSVLVARYSGGSGLAVSLYLMARFLPPLVVGPFAGVLVDRFDRKTILVWCNLLRTIVVLGFLLATTPDTLWLIYALTLVQFTLSAFFEPGQSAITPSLVGRDQLVRANTLASITWSSMLALGALLGGVVAALFGPVVALVIDSLTFAVAGLLIAGIKTGTVPGDDDPEDTPEARSFVGGLRYLRANPRTTAVVLVKGAGSIGNIDLLMTIYATQIFVLGSGGQLSLGIMYSAFGLGAFIGPLLLNRVNDGSVPRMRTLILIGFVFAFLGWLLIGAAGSLLAAVPALVVRAMGGSANWTYSSVILQKTVPDRYLGRVFALDLAMFQLVTVVSTVIHGAAVDIVRAAVGRTQFLIEHSAMFLHEAQMFAAAPDAAGVRIIVYLTALVSLIPVALWALLLARLRLRDKRVPAFGD